METLPLKTYKPLILVGSFIVGLVALVEIKLGAFDGMRAMNHFMSGFFIFFSFFKFLNLSAFAKAFATYDVIAKRVPAYGFIYPFVELSLGVLFLLALFPAPVNAVTFALMIVGNIGVYQSIRSKRSIQCACLGTIFNLPMTYVTLFENSLMAAMSLYMLVQFL